MLSLIVALAVGQVQSDSALRWRSLSNLPGWEGYGPILKSGWVDPVKFRRIDTPGVEYAASGKEAEFTLSPGAQKGEIAPETNVAVPQPNQVQYAQQPTQTPYAQQPAQASYAPQPSGDPYGFGAWLNATRASYGLGPVGYDANLSNWAAMNNSQQLSQGLGHYVLGPARRQNSAMGGWPGGMWMASGPHRAALLDPTITWFGIAAAGAYWTFSAY